MSSTSHDDHDNFDPDNLSNGGTLPPLISNSPFNKPQSSRTEILIALIIMPNTIPKEHAHFTGCAVPFLTYVQCRGTTVPVPLDILSLI